MFKRLPKPLIHKVVSYAHLLSLSNVDTLDCNRMLRMLIKIQRLRWKSYFEDESDDDSFEDSFESFIKYKRMLMFLV